MRYSGGVRTNREPSKLHSMNYFLPLFTTANVKHYVAFQIRDVNLSTSTYQIYPANADPLSLQLGVLRRSDDELCSVWVNTQIGQLPAASCQQLCADRKEPAWLTQRNSMGRETNDARERRTRARR